MNADPGDLPNYKALRSLVAMLETGSVRKAEAQTGSKRVHEDLIAIEGMLGLAYPLLAEQDAGGGLTDDGKRLAGLARGVLIAYGRLDALADEMRRETENVIRVGAQPQLHVPAERGDHRVRAGPRWRRPRRVHHP
jgi:hypothetical protein